MTSSLDRALLYASDEEERAAVVAQARRWIGTPYHNCADVLGVGVDCGMLLVRVFVDAGLVEPFDPRPYPPDWHLHRNDPRYLVTLAKYMHEVPQPTGPGDVVAFSVGRTFSHGAIITDWPSMVHALHRERITLEGPAPDYLRGRPQRFFSYWRSEQ